MISALILAAGMSSRYVGHNKLLLPFGDGPVIRRTVQTVLRTQIDRVVVVTGHDCAKIEAALIDLPITFAHNRNYHHGEMLSSIQTGLTHLNQLDIRPNDAAMIVLGDQPLLPAKLIQRLLHAYALGCGEIIAPRYQALRGHPVLIARQWWAEALTLTPGHNLRELLKAHPDAVSFIQVNSDAVLRDVDTPEAYAEACVMAGIRAIT